MKKKLLYPLTILSGVLGYFAGKPLARWANKHPDTMGFVLILLLAITIASMRIIGRRIRLRLLDSHKEYYEAHIKSRFTNEVKVMFNQNSLPEDKVLRRYYEYLGSGVTIVLCSLIMLLFTIMD